MADYNAVMQQLQQQAQQAAQDRMAALMATGQYIQLEDGGLWDVNREQAISKDQVLGDALVPAMQAYVQANPGDPAAQQIQSDLSQMQAAAHKGDFGSLLHGLAVSAAAGGAMSGAFGGGSILGGLPPAGGEMLGEGVFGPPSPGGSFFTGPPSPGVDGFIPGPAGPTPILGEGLMGPPAPGGDFFTGPPTPAPAAPAGMPPVQNLPGLDSPMLPTVPGTTETILPNNLSALSGGAPAQLPAVQNLPGTNAPTLPTTPGTTNTIIPGDGTAAATAAGTTGNALGNWLRSNGVNVSDDALSVLGKGAGLLTGLLGSNAQQNALQGVLDRQSAERKPALDAFNGALSNPASWYQSAPAMGAAEGILRKLSVNGNPAGNPADLAKAAAYNLGGYNDYLGKMGSLGLSGQATTAQLGSQLAGAQGNTYNLLGAGINELTQQKSDPIADLQRLLRGGSFSLN